MKVELFVAFEEIHFFHEMPFRNDQLIVSLIFAQYVHNPLYLYKPNHRNKNFINLINYLFQYYKIIKLKTNTKSSGRNRPWLSRGLVWANSDSDLDRLELRDLKRRGCLRACPREDLIDASEDLERLALALLANAKRRWQGIINKLVKTVKINNAKNWK